MPTSQDFAPELKRMLALAEQQGKHSLWVTAGQLHRAVGGYPGPRHRMPSCCAVLRAEMTGADRIIAQPPRGNGATLTIDFKFPRRVISRSPAVRREPTILPADPMVGPVRTPTANIFRQALEAIFREAERNGESRVEITSGDLHRKVGGYPGPRHRMPVCCTAMRDAIGPDDTVLAQPPKGDGATLIVAYSLPRDGEHRYPPVILDVPVTPLPEPARPPVNLPPPELSAIETMRSPPDARGLISELRPIRTWLEWFVRHAADPRDPALERAIGQCGATGEYSFWSPDGLRQLEYLIEDFLTSPQDQSRQLRADVVQATATYFVEDASIPHLKETRYGELYKYLVFGLTENHQANEHTSRVLLDLAEAHLLHQPTTGCDFIAGRLEQWFNKPIPKLAVHALEAFDLLTDYGMQAWELEPWYRKWIEFLLNGRARLGVLDLKAWRAFGRRCDTSCYLLGRIEETIGTCKENTRDAAEPMVALPKSGFRIVIFTLRPGTGQHAKELLQSLRPMPEVTVCDAKVLSARAKGRIEAADLGVIVPSCGKHALTEPARDLLKKKVAFAKSPGSLAIAKAVMDFLGDKAVS